MKLSLSRNDLLAALTRLSTLVEKRQTSRILAHVLCHAEENSLRLTASNMEMSASDAVAAEVETPSTLALPAHLLVDIIGKLPEGQTVRFEARDEGKRVDVTCGTTASFKVPAMPAKDFPPLPDDNFPVKFTMSASALAYLLTKTGFAMSREETRRYLGGVYFQIHGEGAEKSLRAVATDGHRLAMAWDALPEGAAEMPSVILPRKAVEILTRIIDRPKKDVRIGLSENRFSLALEEFRFTTRLVDATFPDYQKVIPKDDGSSMQVDARKFRDAVSLVATISMDRSRFVKLKVEDGTLTLETASPDGGEGRNQLPVEFSGDKVEIGFNAGYLMEMAAQITEGKATFVFADDQTPTLVRGKDDARCLYVLMPMRI